MANNRIKVAGYAQRIFFNDNIEYRDFSPDLVGLQLTSDGGTTLFTNGNFSISVNLDPKPDTLFVQGKKSKFYTLDDIVTSEAAQLDIQKNIKTKLNIDLTNPLSYIWYGSAKELIRASLLEIQEKWPAAIYVDNKVGSVTGNNITNYVYDIEADESTFTVNSNYFVNPYGIKYTLDAQYVGNVDVSNPLRNFTLNYGSYVIEHNGIIKKIKSITPSVQKTNSNIELVVEGNPFPELTGIFIPQLSFLFNNVDASIPYFIKPNESEIEKFFSGLNELQSNLLNRNIYPKYKSEIISTNYTNEGVLLTSKSVLTFPVLEDGYNLNFFDSFYVAYIDQLNDLGEGLDETKTDTIIRKYTTEAISSFDTIPRADAADLVLNGEKATKLLRIYGVEFDYIKKYINAIKFAHVVTYDKNNNVPDTLIKDLAFMLGFEPVNFINQSSLSKLFLTSNGSGLFSGTSTNLTQSEIDIELYRRLILNIAWLWKSKGSRKAVEFLFRFIGAPESLANFNEYVVIVEKPLDIEGIKKLLYLYTGEVDLSGIPYDKNGFPLPPVNGDIVITNFIDTETGQIVEDDFTEMYFQKGGGWYRETFGSNSPTVLNGNNPHVGRYDGGNEYLQYFSRCYIPNFNSEPTVTLTAKTLVQNYFLNYNYGIFNGIDNNSKIYTNQLTFNASKNSYQPINDCLDVNYSIVETPLQNDGKTTLQQAFSAAKEEYDKYLELIKKDSYLKYSPEWQVIKNNYELSLKNCLNEISTEDCGINKTLEICLSEKPIDLIEYSCNNLKLENSSPFLYYTDNNGNKISFDEFPACCKSQGGTFVSYVNEYGRQTEYCSKLAPCVGTPSLTLPNGIVVFTMTNNTIPRDIINVKGRCFQYMSKINTAPTLADFSKQINPVQYITEYCLNVPKYSVGATESFTCGDYFKEVSCGIETVISSPECCAWYGYDFQIIEQNNNKFIVCLEQNKIYSPETAQSKTSVSYTFPIIDFSVNNSYFELQNPIGAVYQYYSTEIYWDSFNKARIVKNVVDQSPSLTVLPNSILQDPSLMKPSNWRVESIDEYGRVSFTPKIYSNNFILDWYSSELLSDLYKNIANYYGYQFGKFLFDFNNNVLIPFTENSTYNSNPNSIITAAVDNNRIACSDVNSVAVIFASEKWKGFNLPRLDDCSCTIDFSFDYMLKYNLNSLTECANQITCFPAFIYDNTINNINCLNFVAFTNDAEKSLKLETNFNDSTFVKEEYILWQNSNILEPNVECCKAISGNVVSLLDWEKSNQTLINQITTTYNGILNQNFSVVSSLNFNYVPILNEIEKYDEIKKKLISLLPSSCFVLDFNLEPCDIKYDNYLTTKNVCSLNIPLECGLWSKLYGEYEKLSDEIKRIIEFGKSKEVELCLKYAEAVGLTATAEIPGDTQTAAAKSITVIEKTIEINKIDTQKQEQIAILEKEQNLLIETINSINDTIKNKEDINTIIKKALTNVSTDLNCSVYENNINAINEFDYKEYCNTIVYVNGVNDGSKNNEYQNCIVSKTKENEEQKLTYVKLLNLCLLNNELTEELAVAKFNNNKVLINTLENELESISIKINELTNDTISFLSLNESFIESGLLSNDLINTISVITEILNISSDSGRSIVDRATGNLILSDGDKIKLNFEITKNQSQISKLERENQENIYLLNENIKNKNLIVINTNTIQNDLKETTNLVSARNSAIASVGNNSYGGYNSNSGVGLGNIGIPSCCPPYGQFYSDENNILELNSILQEVENSLDFISKETYNCYSKWYVSLVENYNKNNSANYLKYIDDLKINFKLFVDNNNIDVNNNIDTSLTYLPYTQSVNPIWKFDPKQGYSGILLEGDEQTKSLVEESIFNSLSSKNISYNSDLFEPDWKTFNFTIPECVCDDLRRLYPNKDFYFGIEVDNYECDVCLLVDNIVVNVSDCKTDRVITLNDCLIPELNCVIDNKKSWVYYDAGVVKETLYPNGECNTESDINYEIVKIKSPQERLWTDLEYRYTNYNNYHSDLLINVKNTTFSIDPAKSIECDVFNYWKNIDCDGGCPTNCTSSDTIIYSGLVFSSSTLLNYNIDLSGSTVGLPFSCSTITNLLSNQVIELKNKYYTLTSNYSNSLNATYYDLLNLGYELPYFYIQKNNCGTDTIVLNNNQKINNLFTTITENYDGTLSIYETYLFSGTTPYVGGIIDIVLSGISAQTFNQTSYVNSECCKSIDKLLNSGGVDGLGIGKNYEWDSSLSKCVWKKIGNCGGCKGDCEYCGSLKECSEGYYSGNTYNICVNPLDYLDIPPSEINIKDIFDQLVQSNLIDVKNRQTISDYPLLRLFYELYLNANNCGKNLSGKFTYNTMFEFMDKIGDYWLDLIEQVIPATTIWEGCDNSGKIYRNTIFDQNKFVYKKYSLNYINVDKDCLLDGYTDFSIGQQSIYSLVEQKPIYPTNDEIVKIKNDIKNKKLQIDINKKQLDLFKSRLCSLNLQDSDAPNLNQNKNEINKKISDLNVAINTLNNQLTNLIERLSVLEIQYIEQQSNFENNFMSCSGLSQTLTVAESNLSNYVPGTTSYERQRNYIATLRDKYQKCVRKSNTLVSDYSVGFITQLYETNEYEGNVTIFGDADWDEGGPFYNTELIHNCEPVKCVNPYTFLTDYSIDNSSFDRSPAEFLDITLDEAYIKPLFESDICCPVCGYDYYNNSNLVFTYVLASIETYLKFAEALGVSLKNKFSSENCCINAKATPEVMTQFLDTIGDENYVPCDNGYLEGFDGLLNLLDTQGKIRLLEKGIVEENTLNEDFTSNLPNFKTMVQTFKNSIYNYQSLSEIIDRILDKGLVISCDGENIIFASVEEYLKIAEGVGLAGVA